MPDRGPHAELTERVIGCAIKVHRVLGPGHLESAYEACLTLELDSLGLRVERQVLQPWVYNGTEIPGAFRMDLVVEGLLVVELKVVDMLKEAHEAQVLTYLRFSKLPVGLLLNFGARRLAQAGIRRFVYTPANLNQD